MMDEGRRGNVGTGFRETVLTVASLSVYAQPFCRNVTRNVTTMRASVGVCHVPYPRILLPASVTLGVYRYW